jgi:hypothetical protein
LCHGRHLLVEVEAKDTYEKVISLGLPTRMDLHINLFAKKPEFGTFEPEAFCCVDKLPETWDRKRELVEEDDVKLPEARGGDKMDKCFQVSATTSELEIMKVRECDRCHTNWRSMRDVFLRYNKEEGNDKHLQLGR